jgi:hypothetical protein
MNAPQYNLPVFMSMVEAIKVLGDEICPLMYTRSHFRARRADAFQQIIYPRLHVSVVLDLRELNAH